MRVVRCRAFLAHLANRGFDVGVDQYLAVERLLEAVGDSCRPHELRTLLCPIIARDRDEQARFYAAFDAYYPLLAPPPPAVRERAPEEEPPPPPVRRGRAWRIPVVLAAIAMAVFLAQRFHGNQIVDQQASRPTPREEIFPGGQVTVVAATAPPDPILTPPVQPGPSAVSSLWLLWGAAGLVVSLLAMDAARRRRHAPRRPGTPPTVWPVQAPDAGARLFHGEAGFHEAARTLLRRQRTDSLQLWVEGTVAATVEARVPTLRYRHTTRVPEYLLLVDRHSLRDHQAHLFASVAAALRRRDVYVEVFHFEGDPRLLYSGAGLTIPLSEARRRYPGHRLLVFGSGASFRDPVSGRLREWVRELGAWSDRALLTPVPPGAWGAREAALAAAFPILPATLRGLNAALEIMEALPGADPAPAEGEAPPPATDEVDIEALHDYLGPAVFRWLCACAAYPELHWDLTLTLGALDEVGPGLLTESNLLRLVRLPWFREGAIPDAVRVRLAQRLDAPTERAVRQAIRRTLREHGPREGSAAADQREMEILVQELFLARDRPRERRRLLRKLRAWPSGIVLQDSAAAALVERLSTTPVTRVLPRPLRARVFVDGLSALGTTPGGRAFFASVGVVLFAGAASPFARRPQPDVVEVTLTVEQATLAVGDSIRISAAVLDSAGGPPAGALLEWQTSDSGVVTVSDSGWVRARAPGTAGVVARAGGRASAAARIAVVAAGELEASGMPHPVVRLRPRRVTASSRFQVAQVALPGAGGRAESCTPAVLSVTDGVAQAIAGGEGRVAMVSGTGVEHGLVSITGRSGGPGAGGRLLRIGFAQMSEAVPSDAAALQRLADALRADPRARILIAATNPRPGEPESDNLLRLARLRAIADALRQRGVNPAQIRRVEPSAVCGQLEGVEYAAQEPAVEVYLLPAGDSVAYTGVSPQSVRVEFDIVGSRTMQVGDSLLFRLRPRGGAWPGGVEPSVAWSSQTPAVASVAVGGMVRARAPGSATIIARIDSVRVSIAVQVAARPDTPVIVVRPDTQDAVLQALCRGITVIPSSISLTAGDSAVVRGRMLLGFKARTMPDSLLLRNLFVVSSQGAEGFILTRVEPRRVGRSLEFSIGIRGESPGKATVAVHCLAGVGASIAVTVTKRVTPPSPDSARPERTDTVSEESLRGGAPRGPEGSLLRLVNVERTRAGCRPLVWDDAAARAAAAHAVDMARRNYFDHTSPDGKSYVDRLAAQGVRYRAASENIYWGSTDTEQVVRGWNESPGHRVNLMNCAFTRAGVGYAEGYWVIVLFSP